MIPSDGRPTIVALAGPNGAGKSTFYEAYLAESGLHWINADQIARALGVNAMMAAQHAAVLRQEMVRQRESFLFETVFSDPVGEKVEFLRRTAESGYRVLLIYIGVSGPRRSRMGVGMRVAQGGHDVPADKIEPRYRRSLANLGRAMLVLPWVQVFDNTDLASPYRRVFEAQGRRLTMVSNDVPQWLDEVIDWSHYISAEDI